MSIYTELCACIPHTSGRTLLDLPSLAIPLVVVVVLVLDSSCVVGHFVCLVRGWHGTWVGGSGGFLKRCGSQGAGTAAALFDCRLCDESPSHSARQAAFEP